MQQQPILSEIVKRIPKLICQWELFFQRKSTYVVEGKDLSLERSKSSKKDLFSVRVISEQRLGTSTCSSIDKIDESFNAALRIAQLSDRDEFLTLPEPEKKSKVSVYDQTLSSEKDNLERYLIQMQKAAYRDSRIKKLRNAEIILSFEERGVINSKGLEVSDQFTTLSAHIIAIAEDGDSQMGWAYKVERFLKNIDFEEVGREASERALKLLNPRKINTFKGWALLDPSVASEFLLFLSNSLSAENFQLGKSIYTNKMHERVMDSSLMIIDDGVLPERAGSTPFDAEGVSSIRKVLIEEGILKGLMHNSYTAKRAGLPKSTGNAVRTERGIAIGPTNLYIESSSKKYPFQELLKFINRGIYIMEVMGMHTANPVSGDFSVGVSGILIERGELKHPVKEVVFSGNVGELFKNTIALGDDLTFFGNIGSPTLLVEGGDFSG